MAYYNVCPNCGSNLDPGEKCDCQKEKLKPEETAEATAAAKANWKPLDLEHSRMKQQTA